MALDRVSDTMGPSRTLAAPGLAYRDYRVRTVPDVHLFVYAFPSEADARASQPRVNELRMEGSRSHVLRHGAVVLWVESPTGLPGRPVPSATISAFDGVLGVFSTR